MPEVTEKKTTRGRTGRSYSQQEEGPRSQFRRLFTKPGVSPYDEIEWELRLAQITDCPGQHDLRAEGRRSPQRLVDDRHQHRGQQISARHRSARPSVKPASASSSPASPKPSATGAWPRATSALAEDARHLPRRARAPAPPPVRGLQLARLVQRGLRSHRAQLRRAATGTGIRRPAASNSASPDTRRRSAPPASSTR